MTDNSKTPPRRDLLRRIFVITGESNRLSPRGPTGWLIAALAVAVSLFVGWSSIFGTMTQHHQISTALAMLLPICYLTTTRSKYVERLTWVDYLLAAVSCAVCLWYVFNEDRFQSWMRGFSVVTELDIALGLLFVALIFEICRRAAGWGLTSIMLVLLIYTAFGHLLTGSFYHDPITLEYFTDMQTVSVDGIFGSALYVAATYAFMFVLFGGFYHLAGGGRFFFDLAAAATGRMIGGPSKACVVSSGLYGSISGSPVADVATTGPINIPIMRSVGISPVRAGAIEAAASSGGAMLPPVMGAVAFMMADFTGIPYHEIAKSSLIAALLYYLGVFVLVHFDAQRFDIGRVPEEKIVGLAQALRRGWLSLIPIVVLVALLVEGYSPAYVAAGGTASVVLASWLSRADAIGLRRFVEGCVDTCHRMVPLIAAVAAAGVIIGCIELTGLSGKFTVLLFGLSGGELVPSLVIAAIILILLGMGMPTTGVYIMGIALIAPVFLVNFELPLLSVHMFILYISCMSAITPPVAVACFTAGSIAGANPFKIAPYACKLAVGGFILPFFFIFNPAILMQGTLAQILSDTLLAAMLVVIASIALHGWVMKKRVPGWLRLVFAGLAVGIIHPEPWLEYSCGLLALGLYTILYLQARNVQRDLSTVPAK